MDISKLLKLNSLIASSNESELCQVIIDLDILADKETSLFVKECNQYDLGPFLAVLATLPERTKTCALRLIGKICKLISPISMISKYADIFAEVLRGDYDEKIKTFYLKQLLMCSQTEEGVRFLLEEVKFGTIPFLELVAKNLQNDSLDVAKHVSNFFQALLKYNDGRNHLLSDNVMRLFNSLLTQQGAVIRFRVYQLFVDSLAVNESLIKNKSIAKIIGMLIKELENDDILSQLNCLELLSTLASSSNEALEFITEYGILERLRSLFKTEDLGPLQRLLLPGAVKFFGSIAAVLPTIVLSKYPDFQYFIFENMRNDDIMFKTLCFETIASISSLEEGLILLYQQPGEFNKVMKAFTTVVLSPVDETLKARMIDALKVILTKSDGQFSTESSSIKRELYSQLSEQPIQLLMQFSQLPFSKIRYSALDLISTIASHSWSEQDMAKTPGFLEYLLDRETELEKEGKELKYDILKKLSLTKASKEIFGKSYYEQICKYVIEGPFYSEPQIAVDYEMKD